MLARRCALISIGLTALGVTLLPAPPARSSGRGEISQVFLPMVANGLAPPAMVAEVSLAASTAAVVVRWQWSSRVIPAFRVYRSASGREVLLGQTDPALPAETAIAVLDSDPRWPTLYEDLRFRYRSAGVTDVQSLRAFLQANRAESLRLEAERYPVALFLGTAILDRAAEPGVAYSYRIERVAP